MTKTKEQEKLEILAQDIKEHLNQVIIRCRLHDIESSTSNVSDKPFSAIRNILELIVEDIDKCEFSNTKQFADNVESYYSSNC